MVKIPRNAVEEKKPPCFFQIILPGYSTEHLRIPPRFIRKHIVNKPSKRATLKLKQSSQFSRNVEVRKSRGDVYLKDGWQEFLRDACLGDKEILVFVYNGNLSFNVKVFDKNGCERMDFPNIKTHQNPNSTRSTKRPRGRPRKSSIANTGMLACGWITWMLQYTLLLLNLIQLMIMFMMLNNVCQADMLKEVNEEEVYYSNNTEKSTSNSTEMPYGRPTKTTEENTKKHTSSPTKTTSQSSKRSPVGPTKKTSESTKRPRGRPRKYPVTLKDSAGKHILNSGFDVLKEVKEEKEDSQESGVLFKSKLQYFTSKILKLSQVYVCKAFYVENLSPPNYDFVFLKNSEGTKWYKLQSEAFLLP
uniref:B3 domain-containing protein Os11g0197600-like isoform X2 n=1 Tax=Fragaria vesca subsp. vesca TaxID=101020 RepID=UPI0005CB2A11|nr:PREDICTED: B3 domain-containing protein Os11g0197600-like isoform X2 [Fragaria vesca subsp. vesca]